MPDLPINLSRLQLLIEKHHLKYGVKYTNFFTTLTKIFLFRLQKMKKMIFNLLYR